MGKEYKKLSFKSDGYEEETGVFSGYGAVYGNLDTGGDIIERGAFTKTLANGWERVKILAQHNDYALPIGRPIELREDGNGLYIKGRISDTTMGRDIKTLLRDGVLTELSIGFDPVIFDYDGNGIRHLREVELWEVSIVTFAMNPEAVITDYKSVNKMTDNIISEFKEGRKISKARLKILEETSAAMRNSAKVIDALIKEVSADSAEQSSVYKKAKKSATVEILF